MPNIYKDRVSETTTTTGTGSVALLGARTGYKTFASVDTTSANGRHGTSSKGYVAGGLSSQNVARGDKLTFSSDTTVAQTSANLSTARAALAGCSEGSSKGYFAGGVSDAYVTTADKVTFSSDTTAAQTSANLSQARLAVCGVSEGYTKGYFSGGQTNVGVFVTTTDKITFSSDTTAAQTSANLSQERRGLAGCSEGSSKGYFSSSNLVNADKVSFSTDVTVVQTSANLVAFSYAFMAACSEGTTKGYFVGGGNGISTVNAEKLSFATDTTLLQPSAYLTIERQGNTGCSEGSTKGYVAGGLSVGTHLNQTEKITFTTDTTSLQSSADLSIARRDLAAVGVDAGRFTYNSFYYTISLSTQWEVGIGTLTDSTTLERTTVLASSSGGSLVDFTAGTKNIIQDVAADYLETYRESTDVILVAGEILYANDPVYVNVVDGLAYRADAAIPQKSVDAWIAGFATEDVVPGGYVPVRNVGVWNGLTGLTTGAFQFLPNARYGTAQWGYFAGGSTGAFVSTADKITFSTDATTAQTAANLSSGRGYLAGCCAVAKGYFSGGYSNITATSDITAFATDATVAQTTANLSQARYGLTGCSEGNNKGYFAGGNTTGGSTFVTTTDKIVFTNDVSAVQSSAGLSVARAYLAGASEGSAKGYFSGGNSGGNAVVTDRVIFTTDTTSAYTPANLSQGRYALAASSDGVTAAFIGGGFSGTFVATMDKLVFSTDITGAKTSANLSGIRGQLAACSEGWTKGYFGGGSSEVSPVPTADKVTFSTDTTVATTSADLSQARFILAAFGVDAGRRLSTVEQTPANVVLLGSALNSTDVLLNHQALKKTPHVMGEKGYIAGGYTNPVSAVAVTTADKIMFASDTTTAQTSANLTQARWGAPSSGSTVGKGYVAGGLSSSGNPEVATADKTVFVTDVTSTQVSANLTLARSSSSGSVTESAIKAYFAGGDSNSSSARTAVCDRLLFSTDTTSAVPSANLSQARRMLCGCSEGKYKGFFAGGSTGGTNSLATTDKVLFATESTVAQSSANLSQARRILTGCSEGVNKGFFAGGVTATTTAVTTVDKIIFSTDTTAAQTTANISQARHSLSGCSEGSAKSYFAGGVSSTTVLATTDKVVYATEVTSAQASANLTQARGETSGLSAAGL